MILQCWQDVCHDLLQQCTVHHGELDVGGAGGRQELEILHQTQFVKTGNIHRYRSRQPLLRLCHNYCGVFSETTYKIFMMVVVYYVTKEEVQFFKSIILT